MEAFVTHVPSDAMQGAMGTKHIAVRLRNKRMIATGLTICSPPLNDGN
jgi:hypothetical protein